MRLYGRAGRNLSMLFAGASMNARRTRGIDRTRLVSARRARHEAGALNKRNLVESQRRIALLHNLAPRGQHRRANVMAYRNHRNAVSRPSIYQTVTDRIISSLKAGVIPWEKPWNTPHFAGGPFPRNFYTGKPYRGINVLLLWSSDYSSPFWLTFKQAQALKGSVRKGEHGTQIIFYKQLPEHAEKDAGDDERVPFVLCH